MKRRYLHLACLIVLASCGKEAAGPGPNNNGNTGMSARIDGAVWTPEIPVTAINPQAGLYSISGFRSMGANNYTMVFSLFNITGPGTYQLGVDPSIFGGAVSLSRPPASGWSTPLNGTSGELVITTLTATRFVATFRYDASPLLTGSAGNPRVTEGVIDVPVTGGGGVALANQGNRLTGTFAGAPFAASSALGTITNVGVNAQSLTIVANNGSRTVSIGLANVTAAGTYPLSATTPVRTIGSSVVTGTQAPTWASQGAGGSGSVIITSLTANRIIGSFTATLVPLGGGATGNQAVSGNFDLARRF